MPHFLCGAQTTNSKTILGVADLTFLIQTQVVSVNMNVREMGFHSVMTKNFVSA